MSNTTDELAAANAALRAAVEARMAGSAPPADDAPPAAVAAAYAGFDLSPAAVVETPRFDEPIRVTASMPVQQLAANARAMRRVAAAERARPEPGAVAAGEERLPETAAPRSAEAEMDDWRKEAMSWVKAKARSEPSRTEGTTAKFGTGAVRSDTIEAFRYDLVSPIGLREVARTCAEGAAKYDDFNWEKGMPVHDLLNHALAHIYGFLSGDRSEPHLGHAAWNLLAAIHSDELWPQLNDGHLRRAGCKHPNKEFA